MSFSSSSAIASHFLKIPKFKFQIYQTLPLFLSPTTKAISSTQFHPDLTMS